MSRGRLLILGGTGEAAALARAVAERFGPTLDIITSLAGRAGMPELPGRLRVGGFGGSDGLAHYLRQEAITAVIDATHPFAARISAHAAAACAAAQVPLLALVRPEWERQPGDRWVTVPDMAAAAAVLPDLGRRAFLTVGAGEVAAFAGLKAVWFLVRLLQAAEPPLDLCHVVTGRGPFDAAAEHRLMQAHRIDVVVSKASGGGATYGKITAARSLGLPVLMVARPHYPKVGMAHTIGTALDWLHSPTPCSRG
jgi:precorrin-6A/cobalt-precorrin-6A reductase